MCDWVICIKLKVEIGMNDIFFWLCVVVFVNFVLICLYIWFCVLGLFALIKLITMIFEIFFCLIFVVVVWVVMILIFVIFIWFELVFILIVVSVFVDWIMSCVDCVFGIVMCLLNVFARWIKFCIFIWDFMWMMVCIFLVFVCSVDMFFVIFLSFFGLLLFGMMMLWMFVFASSRRIIFLKFVLSRYNNRGIKGCCCFCDFVMDFVVLMYIDFYWCVSLFILCVIMFGGVFVFVECMMRCASSSWNSVKRGVLFLFFIFLRLYCYVCFKVFLFYCVSELCVMMFNFLLVCVFILFVVFLKIVNRLVRFGFVVAIAFLCFREFWMILRIMVLLMLYILKVCLLVCVSWLFIFECIMELMSFILMFSFLFGRDIFDVLMMILLFFWFFY